MEHAIFVMNQAKDYTLMVTLMAGTICTAIAVLRLLLTGSQIMMLQQLLRCIKGLGNKRWRLKANMYDKEEGITLDRIIFNFIVFGFLALFLGLTFIRMILAFI